MESLPVESFYEIMKYLDIHDIIYIHRTSKILYNNTENQELLNMLSKQYNIVPKENFCEFHKLYNENYVTRNLPKFYSLEESFVRAGTSPNLEYVELFRKAGAKNFHDMMYNAARH